MDLDKNKQKSNKFAILTENLTCDFTNIRALDNIDLKVPEGSIYGFLGHNGAGKTTTIKILLGLLKSAHGKASVLGFDIENESDLIRYNCGALLENTGLYEKLSAEDNLEFFARIWGMEGKEKKPRIKELLKHFGLQKRKKEKVRDWSRGMKQKLAIARVLLHRPSLIFFDEPTAGLDPVAAVSLREDIINLAEIEGVTIFLTTHNLEEAEKICDQVAVIRQGKLIASGKPDEINQKKDENSVQIIGNNFTDDLVKEVEKHPEVIKIEKKHKKLNLIFNEKFDLNSLLSLLIENGGQIKKVNEDKNNLEKAFLELMEEE